MGMTDDSKGDSQKSERFGLGYVDKRYCLKGVAASGWQELKLSGYKGKVIFLDFWGFSLDATPDCSSDAED
mgnify:CR=1 FL=1